MRKKLLFLCLCFLFLSSLSMPAKAAVPSTISQLMEVLKDQQKKAVYNIDLNAPFSKTLDGANDSVNFETGGLTVTKNLVSIPGRNNQNISLSLVYSSNTAGLFEEKTKSVTVSKGTSATSAIYNVFDAQGYWLREDVYVFPAAYSSITGEFTLNGEHWVFTGYYYTSSLTTIYSSAAIENYARQKDIVTAGMFAFGEGWRLNVPYLAIDGGQIMVGTKSGQAYIADPAQSTGLSDYPLSDLHFAEVASASGEGGAQSKYALSYANGDVYSFSDKGRLLSQKDRFGNTISYNWEQSGDLTVLSAIEDDAGHKVSFGYSGELVTVSWDKNTILLRKKAVPGHPLNFYLAGITDQEGRQTDFTYSFDSAAFDLLGKTPAQNIYANLTDVSYQSGLQTKYTYRKATKNMGSAGSMEYFRLTEKFDLSDGRTEQKYGYTYLNEPDGYPTYRDNKIDQTYRYVTDVVDAFGVRTRYTFDYSHLPVKEEKFSEYMVSRTEMTYDARKKLPSEVRNTLYNENGASNEKENFYTYDNVGNLLSETHPPQEAASDTDEYKTEYAYDGTYQLPTSKKYKKDRDTVVEEKYILTSDRKNVAQSTVLENGRAVADVVYQYDSFGNVIEKSQLQEGGERAVTAYAYSVKYGFVFPTTVTYKNVKNADGQRENITTKSEYDFYAGKVTSATDGNGHTTRYTYDRLGRLVKTLLPDGAARAAVYDDDENTILTAGADGMTLFYDYDQSGRLVSVTEKSGRALVRNTYDIMGNLLTRTDANGNIGTYEYDATGRPVTVSANDREGTLLSRTAVEYDDAVTVSGGLTMRAITTNELLDTGVRATHYYYDVFERLSRMEQQAGEGVRTSSYAYDYLGNLIKETDPLGRTALYTYDALKRVTQKTNPDGTTQSFSYDGLGNRISSTNELGITFYSEFDALGRATLTKTPFEGDRFSISRRYYDGTGNVIKTVDPEGNHADYLYDMRGFLTEVKTPVSLEQTDVTRYTYDAEGRVLSMETGGQKTLYAYDELGNLSAVTDPEGQIKTYEYDLNGNLLRSTDRNGVSVFYTYDGLNRMIREENSKDGEKNVVTVSYGLGGAVGEVSDQSGTRKMRYDALGNLIKLNYDNGMVKEYAYDLLNRVTGIRITQGSGLLSDTFYTYDEMGRVTAIREGDKSFLTAYNAAGQIVEEKNGVTGVTSAYGYYPSGLAKSLVHQLGDEVIAGYEYSYDLRGNIVQKIEDGQETGYSYDAKNRIATASLPDGTVMHYTYDERDNIKSLAKIRGEGIDITSYQYDRNNRLTYAESSDRGSAKISRYVYDLEGNLVTKEEAYKENGSTTVETAASMEYNGYNQLSRVITPENEIADYTYNADGLRVRKEFGGQVTNYYYEAGEIVLELGAQNELLAKNLHGRNILFRETGDQTYSYITDIHGDVRRLTDQFGVTVIDYDFDPFGNAVGKEENLFGINATVSLWRQEIESVDNPFRYCGEYLDTETGLYYLRARYYDPESGRFTQEDPVKDGANWYVYCGNNPIMLVDPSGLVEVGLRAYAATYEGADVSWDEETGTARVTYNGTTFEVKSTSSNNRDGSIYVDDSLFVNNFGIGSENLVVYQDAVTKNVSIRASFDYRGEVAYSTIPNSESSEAPFGISYSTAFLRGIENTWSGTFDGYEVSTYARYHGNGIKVSFGLVDLNAEKDNSYMTPPLFGWSKTNPGKITMRTGDSRTGTVYTDSQFMWVSAHEFGHILGVGDAYPNNPGLKTIFNEPACKYGVNEIDITKVLNAWKTNKFQKWP